VDEFGLVEPVEALGQSVVVGVASAADRSDGSGLGQSLGVANRQVLNSSVRVMDQLGQVVVSAAVDGHLECIDGQVAAQRRRHLPADDARLKTSTTKAT